MNNCQSQLECLFFFFTRITVESAVKLPHIAEEPVDYDDGTKLQTNSKQKCQEGTDPSRKGYHRGVELATGIGDQNYPGTPYPKLTPANHLATALGTLSDSGEKKQPVLRKYRTAIKASKSGMPEPDEMVDFSHREEDGIEVIEL